jgi:RNA polymerase sigma-70 factor (ECF subfamily)
MMLTMTVSDTELYRAHADELIRYATVLVGPDEAPDVVTDAVLAAFATPGWHDVAQPRAYLYRAVLNTAMSSHRSRERRRRRELVVAMRPVAPESSPSESPIDVHRALATLSPQQRAVVFLAYWEDQPPALIAATLDVTEGTVRKQLARARAQLRKVIDHA